VHLLVDIFPKALRLHGFIIAHTGYGSLLADAGIRAIYAGPGISSAHIRIGLYIAISKVIQKGG
jgi:hypothetical protein